MQNIARGAGSTSERTVQNEAEAECCILSMTLSYVLYSAYNSLPCHK